MIYIQIVLLNLINTLSCQQTMRTDKLISKMALSKKKKNPPNLTGYNNIVQSELKGSQSAELLIVSWKLHVCNVGFSGLFHKFSQFVNNVGW